MKKLFKGKIIFSEKPDIYVNGTGRTIPSADDVRIYNVKLPDDKIGFSTKGKKELMRQYANNFRGRSRAYYFVQFAQVDINFIRKKIGEKINPGFVEKYSKVKTDNLIRDALLRLGYVKPAGKDVVNTEAVYILKGDNLKSLMKKLCDVIPNSIPTHSFIDKDIKLIVDEFNRSGKDTIELILAYKCSRYWKDWFLINLLRNTKWIHAILPSMMLTTHPGLEDKLDAIPGFTFIDTTPAGRLTFKQIKKLMKEALKRKDKIIWAVSGFDGSSKKRKDLFKLLKSISDNEKLLDLDEVDWMSWKSLKELIESILNGKGGKPGVMVKTGTGYDKVMAGLNLGGLIDRIKGYKVNFKQYITTQQDLEKAKFIDGDDTLNHVIAKGEVLIEPNLNSCSFINERFDNDTITGYSKAYEDGDVDWFKSLLEMFFNPLSENGATNRFYYQNILNKCIEDFIRKYPKYYNGKDTSMMVNRTTIGIQINTQAQSHKQFRKFKNTLETITDLPIFDASSTKRSRIEKDVDRWVRDYEEEIKSAGGFIIINPNWSMANRSFSQGLIDMTLELKDNIDGQADNRPLTTLSFKFNNGLTLDNKIKILGISVHLPLKKEENTMSQVYDNFLSEPGNSLDEKRRKALTPILNHWNFIEDNQFEMKTQHHDPYFDRSKILKSQAMSSVDFEWFKDNQDEVKDMRLLKKKKISRLKFGKSGTFIDPKKANGFASKKEKDKCYEQGEVFINSTSYLIKHGLLAGYQNKDLPTMIDMVNRKKHYQEEFKELTNISIDTWKKIYYNAITIDGKNCLAHLWNMERNVSP